MFQAPLPKEYVQLTPEETRERIRQAKHTLGKRLVILGHHYQRDEIIEHADYRGDSLKLAQDALKHPEAEYIVFCGVHFMAESADIVTPDPVKVILPNLAAGCSMADMANLFQVRSCWKQLEETLGDLRIKNGKWKILPVTYINSAANLKAFVGEREGVVCTSSNAAKIVRWAFENADRVLFFPDQHLGRNTGIKLGLDHEKDMCLWDPLQPMGGNSAEKIRESKLILWKGHCSVHTRFTPEQVKEVREKYPGIKIIVHPECPMEVVQLADEVGSTSTIVKVVEGSPDGTIWAIGTEINLVNRLAKENPSKKIIPLDPMICPCSTMYRIHPSFLCWALENIVKGTPVNVIEVPPKVKHFAKLALDRMLSLS